MADSSSGVIVDYCTNAKCFLALFTCGCADNLRQRLCTDSKLSGFDSMMCSIGVVTIGRMNKMKS